MRNKIQNFRGHLSAVYYKQMLVRSVTKKTVYFLSPRKNLKIWVVMQPAGPWWAGCEGWERMARRCLITQDKLHFWNIWVRLPDAKAIFHLTRALERMSPDAAFAGGSERC